MQRRRLTLLWQKSGPSLLACVWALGAGAPVWAQEDAPGPIAEPAPVDLEQVAQGAAQGEDPKYEDPTYLDAKYAPPVMEEPAPVQMEDFGVSPGEEAEPAGKYDDPIMMEGGEAPMVMESGDDAGPGIAGMFEQALAGLDLRWGGAMFGSLHYRVEQKSAGAWYDSRVLEAAVARYETTFNLRLEAVYGDFRGVADIDFDWLGYGDDRFDRFENLSRRQDTFPVRLEAHALYLEGLDVLVDGLDIRFGNQLVQWGVADQFNPTNVINPEDLENVLRFGAQVANLALRVDYAFLDTWSVSGVVVPIFRPAVLPRSAALGAAAVDRLPFVDEAMRLRLHVERDFALEYTGTATVVDELIVKYPEFKAENFQYALRVGGELFGQAVSFMYYYGRHDTPVAVRNHIAQRTVEPQCEDGQCVSGFLDNTVTVAFPRVHVAGFNLAGELPIPGFPLGYRFELGVYFPHRRRAKITNDDLSVFIPGSVDRPAGEYPYLNDERPVVVDDTPFAKWTLGLDYTLNRYVYLNFMWVHGFADEFGAGDSFGSAGRVVREAGLIENLNPATLEACVIVYQDGSQCVRETLRPNIGDYLVLGVDVKLLSQRLLLRMFGILEVSGYETRTYNQETQSRVTTYHHAFTEEGLSAVLYPEVAYSFGNGLVLGGGALIQLGKTYTKFGDPAAGGSLVFVNGRFDF